MEVYLVYKYTWSDTQIIDIYTTLEKAIKVANKLEKKWLAKEKGICKYRTFYWKKMILKE